MKFYASNKQLQILASNAIASCVRFDLSWVNMREDFKYLLFASNDGDYCGVLNPLKDKPINMSFSRYNNTLLFKKSKDKFSLWHVSFWQSESNRAPVLFWSNTYPTFKALALSAEIEVIQ